MEVFRTSEAVRETAPENDRWKFVLAPKEYFVAPIFAAVPHPGPREVTVQVKINGLTVERKYLIGGFHPMGGSGHSPALDVRHARAIFSLLSFRDGSFDPTGARLIRFSFNQLCRRYAESNGGRYAREIKKIIRDLTDSYIRITDAKTGVAHSYRLIERVDIEDRPPRRADSKLARSNQAEMWFNGCVLSPEFAGLLSDIRELQHLKLDVFTSIRSPLAQAIYLYIPSRAYHHHSGAKPFEITLTKLLEQVSFPVHHHKSRRGELFTKHSEEGRSILQQLDGVQTLSAIFRVRLAETSDGTDYKLQAWVESDPRRQELTAGNSKLIQAWLATGRSRELLRQILANADPLNDYDRDLLEKGEVKLSGNERFFTLAKAILSPPRFSELLSEAKGDAMEGRKAKKTPTARLIYRIMEAVKNLPKVNTSAN